MKKVLVCLLMFSSIGFANDIISRDCVGFLNDKKVFDFKDNPSNLYDKVDALKEMCEYAESKCVETMIIVPIKQPLFSFVVDKMYYVNNINNMKEVSITALDCKHYFGAEVYRGY
jgi:hypothetical protein